MTQTAATSRRKRRTSRLLWIGLALFVLGSGPLLITILLATLGLTRDPDPNPVGFGILAFFLAQCDSYCYRDCTHRFKEASG